ncbi:MAG: hypothetical protein ACO1N9_00750 [Flavobacterium sp.]
MKLIYFFVFAFVLMLGGYLLFNDFIFDNISFSAYLINTLFVLILSSIAVAGIVYLINLKRKSFSKDVMTIRQYYQYKSAR